MQEIWSRVIESDHLLKPSFRDFTQLTPVDFFRLRQAAGIFKRTDAPAGLGNHDVNIEVQNDRGQRRETNDHAPGALGIDVMQAQFAARRRRSHRLDRIGIEQAGLVHLFHIALRQPRRAEVAARFHHAAHALIQLLELHFPIRAVPGEDIVKFRAMMEKVISDPEVQLISPATYPPETPSSSIDTEMYRALSSTQKLMFPGTITIPGMSTGGTDMKGLRGKGMQCYGIGAELPTEDLITHAMHSDNERIKETGLYDFVKYEYSVVAAMATH